MTALVKTDVMKRTRARLNDINSPYKYEDDFVVSCINDAVDALRANAAWSYNCTGNLDDGTVTLSPLTGSSQDYNYIAKLASIYARARMHDIVIWQNKRGKFDGSNYLKEEEMFWSEIAFYTPTHYSSENTIVSETLTNRDRTSYGVPEKLAEYIDDDGDKVSITTDSMV